MGILRKRRFKENKPFEVKDLNEEPIGIMNTVKETFITVSAFVCPFERESLFKTGSEYTFKSIKSK